MNAAATLYITSITNRLLYAENCISKVKRTQLQPCLHGRKSMFVSTFLTKTCATVEVGCQLANPATALHMKMLSQVHF